MISDQGGAAKVIQRLARWVLILASIGLVAGLILSAFVLGHSDRYGRVDIPGQQVLHLPEGEIDVSFRTQLATSAGNGGGLTVPPLRLGVTSSDPSIPDPKVTEDHGTTVTVNGDSHVRVWRLQVASDGDYRIATDGQVSAYIAPQLTFGRATNISSLLIGLGVLIAVMILILIVSGRIVKRQAPATEFAAEKQKILG